MPGRALRPACPRALGRPRDPPGGPQARSLSPPASEASSLFGASPVKKWREHLPGLGGVGGIAFSQPGENRGGLDAAPVSVNDLAMQVGSDEELRAALSGMTAKEAIDSLSGDFAGGNLDLDTPEIFPGPLAEAAYWDDSTVVGLQGPVGSGKTTTMLKSRLRRAMSMPRSVIDGKRHYKLLVIRATYRQLWSTTIPDFLKVYPKHLGDWSGGKGGPVTFVMVFDDGLGEIVFTVEFMAFGDDIQGSLRGYQATDIWLHEMDTNPIEVILNAITRIGRYPDQVHFAGYPDHLRAYSQLVGDFNAPQPGNWTLDLFHDEEKRRDTLQLLNAELDEGTPPIAIAFYRQPGYGEPGCENLSNLPPGYYQRQIAVMTLQGRSDQIDRMVRNKIVHEMAGEPVFRREFRRRLHVAETTLKPWAGVPLRIGMDQGLKGAAIIGQVISEGTGPLRQVRWQILAELHFPKERLLARVFGERLADLLATLRFAGCTIEGGWADMAGEHGASEAADENDTWNKLVGRAAGFRVRPQRIGTNRITPRLEAVRATLEAPIRAGEPGILIDPSCQLLIAGFEARYVWTFEVNANGDKRKVPDKSLTEANVMDALQYLLLSMHRADGTAPGSFPPDHRSDAMGHNGGPPLDDRGASGGLRTDYDLLNPYGGH